MFAYIINISDTMPDELNTFFKQHIDSVIQVNDRWKPVSFGSKEKYHFILPITYITPTYIALDFFTMVSSLSNLGHTVSIFLHDNNLLAHQRSRQEVFSKSNIPISKYIEHTIEEIEILLSTLKADKKNIKIIKASDMWAVMSQSRSDFFAFYGLLGNIRYNDNMKDTANFYHTAYHAIQRPFDIYFAKNYSALLKSDLHNPDFMIIPYDRLVSYTYIRNKMISSPTTASQSVINPLFCTTKPSFIFSFKDTIPSCRMSVQEIEHIINESKSTIPNKKLTMENVIIPMAEFLNKIGILDKQFPALKNPSNYDIASYIYNMVDPVWQKSKEHHIDTGKDILVSSKFNFEEIKEVLSSRAILKTLFCCNGELTISEIAKKLGQHISNTSSYANKLRKLGLITTDQKPKIKFNRLIIEIGSISAVLHDS